MISKTLSLYKSAYSGLSPSTWWLSFIMLVNRSGTMVLPFMTIYLTTSKGYSIGKAGVVMALFGLGAVTGAFLGGRLTDRIGHHTVQLITLLGDEAALKVLNDKHKALLERIGMRPCYRNSQRRTKQHRCAEPANRIEGVKLDWSFHDTTSRLDWSPRGGR